MTISVEEVKAFICDCEKNQESWLCMAKRSWDELKKRQKNGQLWSLTPNSTKKKSRYPVWYSIFKIRQPLVLSRVGIPIGRDTTQDGNDNIGATAAICLERLAVNLAKSFDFFDVMSACRDDFLATNFSICRGYYERSTVMQKVKEYITPEKSEETGEVVFIDSKGEEIYSDAISQDDEGYFLEHDQTVEIVNEKICLEPVMYKNIYIDPNVLRWARVKRMAFKYCYSEREFKEIFGAKAFATLPAQQMDKFGDSEASTKRQKIEVIEYWDEYEKECKWLPVNGPEFIEPKDYLKPEDTGEGYEELNGLYNLANLFPVPEPLMMNQPTDEFWPVPEYYQLFEIFDDIHTIFSRMMALTRAIRARILFDANVEGLQEALNEASEGDAIGVSNLAQALSNASGTLDGVVQYIPVDKLIQSLSQIYEALEQRLNTCYRLTGTSDMLQGLAQDQTQRTFGERQMNEKYALNQLAEPQRKMQEFVRSSYQLICEMALKNFKDSSLDLYIMPQTLQPEDQERYSAAMEMLKQNQKRFRIELETDSTIALNEEYDKQRRIEFVNALTTALEKTANIATVSPALIIPELHCLKLLIQGFRQGKMFQSEVTESIDNVIKQAEDQPAPFNKDEVMANLKAQELKAINNMEAAKLNSTNGLEQAKMQSYERIEIAKLQQRERETGIETQLETFKTQISQGKSQADLQLRYAELNAEIAKAQQETQLKYQELMAEAQGISDKKDLEMFNATLNDRIATYEMGLKNAQQRLEEYRVQMDEREKYATEARLQSEHQLQQLEANIRMAAQARELQFRAQEAAAPPPVHVTVVAPAQEAPKPRKRTIKVERDELGNPLSYESIEG